MSRARHKEHKRAEGGRLSSEPKWNAGGEQNAAKEAEEKKRGGRVHGEGAEAKKRMDKRARGGHVKMKKPETEALKHEESEGPSERKHGGHVKHESKAEEHREYEKEKHEHKKRARGGRIGADKAPLSSAAKVKHITKGETPEEGIESD